MKKRLATTIVLIIGAMVFPWWLTAAGALAALLLFEYYYEVVIVGLVIDILFGTDTRFWGFGFLFTSAACLLLIAAVFARARIRMRESFDQL